jgi:putative solute:sodium symporter small subunit
MDEQTRREYWRKNVRLMSVLLAIWALVSFGAGILFAEFLNRWSLGDMPLGYWFSSQGSILVFLALIAIYVWRMDRLDAEAGVVEYEAEVHHS